MPKALSEDIRERIISYSEKGLMPSEIADKLLICVRTVNRIKKLYRETGSVKAKAYPKTNAKRIFLKDENELAQFVAENPDLSGKEIAAHFGCSSALICIRLSEAKITYKKRLLFTKNKAL